ncbi:MAG: hypothetical protein SVR08_17135 [Spirochaetota bacterium]|nr:hypothetical protein [Spirochaetota bacterium]
MPWEVKYIEAENIVVILNSGELGYEDFVAEAKEGWRVMRQYQSFSCIVDDRNYSYPVKVTDLYSLPELYDSIGVDRKVKVALLFNPGNPVIGDFEFFETVCQNRGYNFRVFYDESEAKSWLK